MAFVFRDLTEKENIELADYGQRIMALGAKKGDITIESASAEVGWQERAAKLDTEIAKNNDAIINIRSTDISGQTFVYSALTDNDTKTIIDLTQRNQALILEKAKIQTERAMSQVAWSNRKSVIDGEVHKLMDAITYMRDAEVSEEIVK